MYEFATRITGAKKIVFTKTLEKSLWDRTELAKGNIIDEVRTLKQQMGKDLIVYGGSSFVSSLIKHELIDEFHFFVNPIAIGRGESAFSQLDKFQALKLVKTISLDSGLIILHYEKSVQ